MQLRRMALAAFAVIGLLSARTAQAAWHRASSPHFIIYSEQDPETLRTFASRLELFDQATRHVRRMKDVPVSDGNRLTIFVVRDEYKVQRLVGDRSGMVNGLYVGRASGPFAFVPRYTAAGSTLKSETIFFHEYAHHLMFQEVTAPSPEWLVEGFAEFMSTARLNEDGSVELGTAPKHRAYGLHSVKPVPLEELLGGTFEAKTVGEVESLYARGWLLTHFLTFKAERAGQLHHYLLGIANGEDAVQSARKAFGNLEALDRELADYMKRKRIAALRIPPGQLSAGRIDVSAVSRGASELLPLHIRLRTAGSDELPEVARDIRGAAKRYSGDSFVENTLAQAELRMGRYADALAAAERVLAKNPADIEAMIQKGRALVAGKEQRTGSEGRFRRCPEAVHSGEQARPRGSRTADALPLQLRQ